MADDEDPLAEGSFSHLLFADYDDDIVALDHHKHHHRGCSFNYYSSFPAAGKPPTPRMICFGDSHTNKDECDLGFAPDHAGTKNITQKSGVTCSNSSSASSTHTSNAQSLHKNINNRKRNGSPTEPTHSTSGIVSGAPLGCQKTSKKTKQDKLAFTGHAKGRTVKKEKLGERLTALQQLVSPFGKTDTASVLHEAMGYIRFLHNQVQVLCSPYLQCLPSSAYVQAQKGNGGEGKSSKDLRSRGLCLVPVECTAHVASSNGADFWSPAMRNTPTVSLHQPN
uniref:Transcription factor bHLH63 n=1 Tax=Nothapodytes nimmoniana TaxID=159386 RepID=A0A9E8Z0I0_NOTNI|nr:transcription factor bHLH63 [Nothapodytes nimmoniana]